MSTSSISNLINSNMRISGLNSGLDTDAMVRDMLKIEQYKVDKQFKTKTKIEWKQESYRDINSKLKTFREKYFSVLKPESNMMNTSSYLNYKLNITNNEDGAISLDAGWQAKNGASFTIDEITQLASSSKMRSSDKVSVAGKEIPAGYDIALKDLELSNKIQFVAGEVEFKINNETFKFNQNDTLSKVVDTINKNEKAGVNLTYNALTDKFTLETKASGADTQIKVQNVKGNIFAANASESAFGLATGTVNNGTNAKFKIDGEDVERSSNTFEANGIKFTLNKTTDEAKRITVENDTDATFNKIKDFVDAYNELYTELYNLYTETQVKNPKTKKPFDPLTTEERKVLSEDEAKVWEQKAKTGLVRGDAQLGNLLNELRSSFFAAAGGTGAMLSQIGISTSDYFTTETQGTLTIDEAKLRSAIEADPEKVANMFAGGEKAASDAPKTELGAIRNISSAFLDYTQHITDYTLSNLGNQGRNADNRLTELTRLMQVKEEQLWAKFTAMEKAISSLNSQTSYFTSLLGGSAQ